MNSVIYLTRYNWIFILITSSILILGKSFQGFEHILKYLITKSSCFSSIRKLIYIYGKGKVDPSILSYSIPS